MVESPASGPPGTPRHPDLLDRLSRMSADELTALLVHLDNVERVAGAQLRGDGELSVAPNRSAEISQRLPALTQAARGSATNRGDIPAGSAAGTVTWMGSANGYAPPVQAPDAVVSLWESIKPKSTDDALAIVRELRK